MNLRVPKLVVAALCLSQSSAFQPSFSTTRRANNNFQQCGSTSTRLCNSKYQDGQVGKGDNWIEKSFPVETNEKIDVKKVDDYNLGVSGNDFQTGPLGKKMYDAIISRTSLEMSDEIKQAFTMYAMDFTAKEAARAALNQNGLQMVLQDEEEDAGMWGDIEAIRLYDEATGIKFNKLYDSIEEAATQWTPGQQFDFVVRQVPAKIKELSVDELLQALDPEGSLREEAKEEEEEEANQRGLISDEENVEEALMSIYDEAEMSSLKDLADDCNFRTENSPREATTEANAYAGDNTRGYNAINISDLSTDPNGGEKEQSKLFARFLYVTCIASVVLTNIHFFRFMMHTTEALMHVMDAFVSHGVLLVDLTDGGKNYEAAKTFAKVWDTAEGFFGQTEDMAVASAMPGMATVMETGSKHAKVGYAEADNRSLRFLETRVDRKDRKLLPVEARNLIGDEGAATMLSAFDIVADVSKSAVRIATAASSVEHGAFIEREDDGDSVKLARASNAASLLANELVDDGKALGPTVQIDHDEGTVSMSPHRLCRYAWENDESTEKGNAREIFGAHTDSSFITAVPVASVCGLEVLDEATEQWYRPELRARALWEAEQTSKGRDPSALVEELEDGSVIPWHSRYVALMAGEHLQLVTRSEIPATVHRVVATKKGPPRFSSPILIRGRPGVRFDANRYLGGTLGSGLLQECNEKTMEEIYEATQPSAFQ